MVKRLIASCLLALLFVPAWGQMNVSTPVATVVGGNVLRYQVSFTTSASARTYVEYGHAQGQDSIWEATGVSGPGLIHSTRVIGLLPQTPYSIRAVAFDDEAHYRSSTATIVTGALPANLGLPVVDSVWLDSAEYPPGYVLTGSPGADPERTLQILNREGKIIWYALMPGDDAGAGDSTCQAFSYTAHNRRILALTCDSVHDFSLDGSFQRHVRPQGLPAGTVLHHDVMRTPAGGYACLVARPETVDQSGSGGSANALVIGDGMTEMDSTGAVTMEWSSFDDYNPAATPGPGGHWTRKYGPNAIDWKGTNSLMLDIDGHYMLAFRNADQVMKLDGSINDPAWALGRNGNFLILPPDTFMAPASIRLSRPGYYLLYDHAGLGATNRVIEFWIDWNYTFPLMVVSDEFVAPAGSSPAGGHVEQLENGRRLVSTGAGRLYELHGNSGQIAWEARVSGGLERAYHVPHLYDRPALAYLGDTVFCTQDSFVSLAAFPVGGHWSGTYVVAGEFYPGVAGAGLHTMTYYWGPDSIVVQVRVDSSATCGVGIADDVAPLQYLEAFPNPFRDGFDLRYQLPRKAHVRIDLYGLDGRHAGNVLDGRQGAGLQHMRIAPLGYAGPLLVRVQVEGMHTAWKLMVQMP